MSLDSTHCRSWRLRLGVLLLGLLSSAAAGRAQIVIDVTWEGGVGNYTDSNWRTTLSVISLLGIDFNLRIDGGKAASSVVNITTLARIRDLVVSPGDALNITSDKSLTLSPPTGVGAVENAGTISLSSSFANTDLVIDGAVTFSGTGNVTLGNHPNNRVIGTAATDHLINAASHTFQGSGQFGANLLRITNAGLIIANQPHALILNPSASGAVNTGTLRATNGATLILRDGTFNNTGGLIEAHNNSHVDLDAVALTGGTLSSSGTSHFHVSNLTAFTDVTISAGSIIEVGNNHRLLLNGTLTNHGTVSLLSDFNLTDLVANGSVTLDGAGTLTLGNHPNNRILGVVASDRLTNQGNTIQGAGQIGADFLALTNRGIIQATYSAGHPLVIDLAGTNNFNSGTIKAASGATLRFTGTTLDNAESTLAGIIRADSGTVQFHGSSLIRGGNVDVSGAGEIQLNASTLQSGNLINSATGIIRATGGVSVLDGVRLTNPVGGQLLVDNDARLRLTASGTYLNSGFIALNSNFNHTEMIVSGGDLALTGGGILRLGNHPNNRILGATTTDRLVNQDNTIEGSGQLGADTMGFINRGTITANLPHDLVLNPSSAGVINRGTLRASGGTLNLIDGTFTNSEAGVSGTIEALDASRVDLNTASVSGGFLATSGTGLIRNIGTVTLANVTLTSGSHFVAVNDADTTLVGTLTNHGTFSLNSDFNHTDLIIGASDVTLVGGGTLALSNHPNNRIISSVATHQLINFDHTIQGSGQLGADTLGLVNRGVIVANQSHALTIDPSAAGVVNRGTLRAEDATLNLVGGSFINQQDGVWGLIEAVGKGSVDLNGVTITGGMLSTSAGGTIRNLGTATLEGVLLSSDTHFSANNATVTTLAGQITNYGTFSLNSDFNHTDLVVSPAGVTLEGFGTLAFSNHPNNRVLGNATLINASSHTIRGSGQLGVGQLALTNHGVIVADQSNPLTIDVADTTAFENHGMLRATNGATLVLADHTTNRGLVAIDSASTLNAQAGFTQAAGATALDGGTLTASSSTFSTGIVYGSGTINGPVLNAAVLSPGASGLPTGIGQLTFSHSLTLTSTSLLHIELNSLTSTDTVVAQSATLGGALAVTFATPFGGTLLPSDTFTLLTTTGSLGLGGSFAGLANGSRFFTADGTGSFQVNYLANALTISAFQAIPEPSTYALLALGAAVVAFTTFRRRSR